MRPLQHTLLRGSLPGAALERGRPRHALQEDKKAGGAEQYNANKKYSEAVAVAARNAPRTRRAGVLHLHAGPALENEGGPRTRVLVPRDGGLCACVVLAEQAKILFAEAEENNLDDKFNERWTRWYTCGLCEQGYHGVVACALGRACWKTSSRPERLRRSGDDGAWNGLSAAEHHEDALSVKRPSFLCCSALAPAKDILTQSNLAMTTWATGTG